MNKRLPHHAKQPALLPRLLLGVLVVVLVLGACATVYPTRKDRRFAPLSIHYNLERQTILFIPVITDTTSIDFVYRGQRLPVPQLGTGHDSAIIRRIRRQAGPEPRWLVAVASASRTRQAYSPDMVYLLRLPPNGSPEYHQIGPTLYYRYQSSFNVIPLAPPYVFLISSDTTGALFNQTTFVSQPVRLPTLRIERSNWLGPPCYSLSPDGQQLGRAALRSAEEPDRNGQQLLLLDQYDLTTGQPRRQLLPNVQLPPAELPSAVGWRRRADYWELYLR